MIGSFVGVLLSETTWLRLMLPKDLRSGAKTSFENNAELVSRKSEVALK